MSYKTILVHADHSTHAAERIRIAANLAMTENAHLIGIAMTGISRFTYEVRALGPAGPNLETYIEFLRTRAMRALTEFESIAQGMGVLSLEKRLVDDEAGAGISLQARYCDLVVIGQNDPNEPSPTVAPDFPAFCIRNCGRPVLLVPYTGRFEPVGKRVLIAWDFRRRKKQEGLPKTGWNMPFLHSAMSVSLG
ncbi:MAG TPA: hypothetical protein DIT28_13965 [Oxalobacteraceae bacterium]|nr:hypothetical protein [Oxalobacteraceae bacterium]